MPPRRCHHADPTTRPDTIAPVPPWRLFIDTGGTFTDCLALDPTGRPHRAKVLSSSRLRGRVLGLGPSLAAVHFGSRGLPADLPRGGLAASLREPQRTATVLGWEPDTRRLLLSEPLPLHIGDTIDIAAAMEPPLLAAHLVTATPLDRSLPPIDLRLATTRATNALLERRVARTALVTTRGMADLLLIGDQRRPDLFALDIRRPPPLPEMVLEVDERIDAHGAVVRPIDPREVENLAARVRAASVQAVAVALLHSWIEPRHERQVVEALRRAGVRHVVASSARSPTLGVLDRATRAVVDASLGPVMAEYLEGIAETLAADTGGARGSRFEILTSAGGLVAAKAFAPADGLLSGPAGGVVGAAAAARASGFDSAIGLDMGGTSTDVAEAGCHQALRFRHRVGDVEIAGPALAIETVAAGGGSIVRLDQGHLAVGPSSAGADPGPACYGRGGPLTLTDVDCLLGRLAAERFEIPIDLEASRTRAEALFSEARRAGRAFADLEAMLEAAVDIADERMAEAIAAVSIRRGVPCEGRVLVAFGGAGGLHACAIAERLGMDAVLVPPAAGLLSALGLAGSRVERIGARTLLAELPEAAALVAEAARDLVLALERELEQEPEQEPSADLGDASTTTLRQGIALMRRVGQESTVDVRFDCDAPPSADDLLAGFRDRYRAAFGHLAPDGPVEVESIRVIVARRPEFDPAILGAVDEAVPEDDSLPPSIPRLQFDSASTGAAGRTTSARVDGRWCPATLHRFEDLPRRPRSDGGVASMSTGAAPGDDAVRGPALVAAPHWSAWVPTNWSGGRDHAGALVLRRLPVRPGEERPDGSPLQPEPMPPQANSSRLSQRAAADELVAGRLQSIAEEMGELLRRTALSVNVKERLDFSCGLLDAEGRLAANAPHVPVHLGALGPCVRRCREWLDRCEVLVVNHPAFGGSHLPDVTVLTAIRDDHGDLIGVAASRAHHAELGGIRPGSMPPFAGSLAEEAVVIPPTPLVVDGRARWDDLRRLLCESPHPSRAVEENLADLAAAVAANAHGATSLRRLAADLGGAEHLARHFGALRRRAAMLARRALRRLPPGRHGAVEHLDDGSRIAVVVEIRDDSCEDGAAARVDFTGTAGVHPAAFNATEAIVRSAVLYVLRLLVDQPLPLNEGLLDPIDLHLPTGLLSPIFSADPRRCPAVGAGNTETSQRVVDVLLSALGVCAASQGTMNNVLYGIGADDRAATGPRSVGSERGAAQGWAAFGAYETIGGGAGATPNAPGADAVHVHMTNTRITDVEILERRYPVRVERFSVRRGSGGRGAHRGGDGIVRETRFLAPMSLSILSQRRLVPPPGSAGGLPGLTGRNTLVRASGETVDLGPCASLEVAAGDLLRVETPGGGGWGAP